MTATRDPDRLLRAWLDLMPDEAPDRALSTVLRTVAATPQERGPRLAGPRRSFMNRLSLIAAVAVIAAALAGGAILLTSGHQNDIAVPTAHATASPTTSTPRPSILNLSVGYPNLRGWIVFEHFGQAPDGSTSTFDAEHRMIWLVHADGSGLHELAPGNPPTGKTSPDVSPDGSKVAFMSWLGEKAIYEAPIDGGAPTAIAMNCPAGLAGCEGFDPAYSADGRKIAFVRLEANGERVSTVIAITELATGATVTVESSRESLAAGYLAQPSWSPDGSQIVYYRVLQADGAEHPTDTRLFVLAADDSSIRELPQPPGYWAADPDWSPDGSTIVFSTAPNHETEGWGDFAHDGIFTIKPDGTGLAQVCDTCLDGGWAPSWTPDGKHILFWGYRSWALIDPDGRNGAHINQPRLTWFGELRGYGYAAVLQPSP